MESQGIFYLALLLFSVCISRADFVPEDDDPLQPLLHDRVRRFVQVRFKSRLPGPDAQDEYGIGFPGHVKNILKGGTFGVDFRIKQNDKLWGGEGRDSAWALVKKEPKWENNEKELRMVDYGPLINPRVNRRPEP